MVRWFSCLLFAAFATVTLGCASPYHADRGAAIGAVTGGLAGAAIGNHNGEAGAGAAIGAAVGALTGAAIGSGMDEVEARNQAIIQEQMGRKLAGAASIEDVSAMTAAGLGDDVIMTHIRTHGVAAPLTAADLITLKSRGVSDRVMQAMQQQGPPTLSGPPAVVGGPAVIGAPAVIVQEPCYGPPPVVFHHAPYYHRRHHHHHPRPGFHWGVAFHD